jgi:methylated-DNA-[protein]-cysteine S-methyltransferase
MTLFTYMNSPLGSILLTSDGEALTGAYFVGQKYEAVPGVDWKEDSRCSLLAMARAQLLAYFDGRQHRFEIPVSLRGTQFQLRVWQALCGIQFGTTLSYAQLADTIEAGRSVRAVGSAVGRNPISIVVPCHRVIGSDGSLTGYAGGLNRKRALLVIEGITATANAEAQRSRRTTEIERHSRQGAFSFQDQDRESRD